MALNPLAIAFASLLAIAPPAFAQTATKAKPCISIVSHSTPTARTSTYANKCATECFEFTTTTEPEVVPRGHLGMLPALSKTAPVIVRVEPGETKTASWQWRSPDHPETTTVARNCPSS